MPPSCTPTLAPRVTRGVAGWLRAPAQRLLPTPRTRTSAFNTFLLRVAFGLRHLRFRSGFAFATLCTLAFTFTLTVWMERQFLNLSHPHAPHLFFCYFLCATTWLPQPTRLACLGHTYLPHLYLCTAAACAQPFYLWLLFLCTIHSTCLACMDHRHHVLVVLFCQLPYSRIPHTATLPLLHIPRYHLCGSFHHATTCAVRYRVSFYRHPLVPRHTRRRCRYPALLPLCPTFSTAYFLYTTAWDFTPPSAPMLTPFDLPRFVHLRFAFYAAVTVACYILLHTQRITLHLRNAPYRCLRCRCWRNTRRHLPPRHFAHSGFSPTGFWTSSPSLYPFLGFCVHHSNT